MAPKNRPFWTLGIVPWAGAKPQNPSRWHVLVRNGITWCEQEAKSVRQGGVFRAWIEGPPDGLICQICALRFEAEAGISPALASQTAKEDVGG